MSERTYYDLDGNEKSLWQMVRDEPEWAASRIREAERLETERDGWIESARDFANGQDFYRGIVHQIGELFGVEARTSDDGSVQDEVLALKVPELAAKLREQNSAMRAEFDDAWAELRAERDALAAKVAAAQQLADNDRVNHPEYGDPRTDFVNPGWKSALGRDLHVALKGAPETSLAQRDARTKAEALEEIGKDCLIQYGSSMVRDLVRGRAHYYRQQAKGAPHDPE